MQDTHAVMTYTDEDAGTEFQWHGGEYIDVGTTQAMGEPGIHGTDFHAYDCINVWDHAAGEARISGFSEFEETCREYLTREDNIED